MKIDEVIQSGKNYTILNSGMCWIRGYKLGDEYFFDLQGKRLNLGPDEITSNLWVIEKEPRKGWVREIDIFDHNPAIGGDWINVKEVKK